MPARNEYISPSGLAAVDSLSVSLGKSANRLQMKTTTTSKKKTRQKTRKKKWYL